MTTKRRPSRPPQRRTAPDPADAVHTCLDLLKAALDAAIGVKHLYTRDSITQQWVRVTDPDAIAAFLNQPNGGMRDGWTIYTTDPDVDLLRTLLAFQFGPPFVQPGVPDLAQVLLHDPETGALVPLRERLQSLRAAPRPAPDRSGLFDDNDRVH